MDPITLAAAAAKEIAQALRVYMEKQPDYEQKQFNRLFELKVKYEEEKARTDRDHDDLLKWRDVERVFSQAIIEEITRA
jgi:hypothetical protein